MNNKTFYISIAMAAFFLMGGLTLGGVLSSGAGCSFFKPPPRLAVVDMQALIAKRSQYLIKTNSNKSPGKSPKVSSHQICQASEQLKEILESFASKHHLILLAKGAVMGGNLPDYTAEIMKEVFSDYTTKLLAFIEKKTAKKTESQRSKSSQLKSHRLESHRLESQDLESHRLESQDLESPRLKERPKGQGPNVQEPMGQENQL